jgi:hypothetical protein
MSSVRKTNACGGRSLGNALGQSPADEVRLRANSGLSLGPYTARLRSGLALPSQIWQIGK